MHEIIEHIPSCCGDYEQIQKKIIFSSLNDLIDKDTFVKSYMDDDKYYKFYRFSVNKPISFDRTHYYLMAEYENGYHWVVVGYLIIDHDLPLLHLPEWIPKRKDENSKDENRNAK